MFLEGDHALFVDLDNVLSVEAFAGAVKTREVVVLEEAPHDAERALVRSTDGGFANEIVLPMVAVRAPERSPAPLARPGPVARTFIAGSEWLSTKISMGAASTDDLLRDVVPQLVARARESGAIDRWFFLPVRDPCHLRLRLHGGPARLHTEVLPALERALAPWLADGSVRGLEIDTYVREVERYGGAEGVVLAERMFSADSDAALALIAGTSDGDWADARWRLVLLAHDALLDDLGLDPDAKLALVTDVRDGYAREFAVDAALSHAMAARIREARPALDALLERDPRSPLAFAVPIVAARSAAIAPWARDLRDAAARGALQRPIEALAKSYLHLNAGRLLRAAHRMQELVIAEALARVYESRIKRARR